MKASIHTEMADEKRNKLTDVIKEYGNQISRFIRSKVPNSEDAKDILQDVWYQFSRVTNIDEIESVSGWLYNVSRNRITDNYRKKKPESIENFKLDDDESSFSFKDILLIDDSNNPELAFFKEVFWTELIAALEELPEKQKDVFVLNEIEDLTLQEIADQKSENLKTIISRKGYAVKHLRKKLNYLYKELYT